MEEKEVIFDSGNNKTGSVQSTPVGGVVQKSIQELERLIPEEVRRELGAPFMSRLVVITIYLLVGTLLGFRYGLELFGWWLGGLIGFYVLDVDHLLDVYFLHPESESSKQVKEAIKHRQWRQAWRGLLNSRKERKQLVLHSVVFQVVILILAVYVVTSAASMWSRGLILSFGLRILSEQVREFMATGKMDSWFWQIKDPVPMNLQAVFLTVGMVVWVILTMAVI